MTPGSFDASACLGLEELVTASLASIVVMAGVAAHCVVCRGSRGMQRVGPKGCCV